MPACSAASTPAPAAPPALRAGYGALTRAFGVDPASDTPAVKVGVAERRLDGRAFGVGGLEVLMNNGYETNNGYELRVYRSAIHLVELCTPLADRIRRRNKALAVQLDRCAPSVPLNIAEGEWRTGGHGRERLETAMGSAREVKAVLDVTVAARLLSSAEVAEAWQLADRICASLWKMTRRAA